jgi:hypothetical protein
MPRGTRQNCTRSVFGELQLAGDNDFGRFLIDNDI